MDILGRYYTQEIISTLLINNLLASSPRKILDLGIGDGSLTLAANLRWNSSKYFATEIEKHKIRELENKFDFIKLYNYDSLQPTLSSELKIKIGSMDVAICNPPYVRIKNARPYKELFNEIKCYDFNKLKIITSEIVFFAQNISLLKQNGELGIIISDSLITGKDFYYFRKTILENFEVKTIIQLPDKIFKKTEARTHILILTKSKPLSKTCRIYQSDFSGKLSKKIDVLKSQLYNRMDYQFFHLMGIQKCNCISLKDIGAEITRGSITYKGLRNEKIPFFHSTNFRLDFGKFSFNSNKNVCNTYKTAKKGNILLCRVGKRCVGRLAFVSRGAIVVSDCVYRIALPQKYEKIVWDSFISKKGQLWLKAFAHGVCSQVISKSDLEKFPLYSLE